MMKEEFHLRDADFTTRKAEGLETVVLNRPPALKAEQIAALVSIVGKENVSLDDYSRVKYAHGKTTEEILELLDTLNQAGKTKRFGRHTGRRRNTRKAYVSLAPGQEINFVEAG